MSDFFAFFVTGVGLGAVYALIGLGIMALYRSTGVLNFAYGAMGMIAVFVYVSLTNDAGLAPGLAVVVLLVLSAPVGAVIELVAMRRLQHEPLTTKAVATIALLVGLIGTVELIWGAEPRRLQSWLPEFDARIADVAIPSDRVLTLAVVLLVLAGFWFLFTRTRMGIALRAMATDRNTAALVGVPVGRLTLVAWAGTAVLATLSILLVAPARGLDPGSLSLVVIPGLAAAVIGDLRNPVQIVLGGLALGVIEAEAGLFQWTAENDQIVPFVVLLAVLLWRQRHVVTPAILEHGRA